MNKGDLLDVTNGIIVHGCNAHGVMGSGVANAVRRKYPGAYEIYREAYNEGLLKLGTVVYYQVTTELVIANAITQQNFGGDGKRYVSYDAVDNCMRTIAHDLNTDLFGKDFPKVVHMPLIGAGLGGGDWDVIYQIVVKALGNIPNQVWTL